MPSALRFLYVRFLTLNGVCGLSLGVEMPRVTAHADPCQNLPSQPDVQVAQEQ